MRRLPLTSPEATRLSARLGGAAAVISAVRLAPGALADGAAGQPDGTLLLGTDTTQPARWGDPATLGRKLGTVPLSLTVVPPVGATRVESGPAGDIIDFYTLDDRYLVLREERPVVLDRCVQKDADCYTWELYLRDRVRGQDRLLAASAVPRPQVLTPFVATGAGLVAWVEQQDDAHASVHVASPIGPARQISVLPERPSSLSVTAAQVVVGIGRREVARIAEVDVRSGRTSLRPGLLPAATDGRIASVTSQAGFNRARATVTITGRGATSFQVPAEVYGLDWLGQILVVTASGGLYAHVDGRPLITLTTRPVVTVSGAAGGGVLTFGEYQPDDSAYIYAVKATG